jgi:hypothetical protein
MLCIGLNWEFEREMLDWKGQWPIGTCGWRHQDSPLSFLSMNSHVKGKVGDSI